MWARLVRRRGPWLLASGVAALGLAWIALLLAIPVGRAFVVLPRATTGLEVPVASLHLVSGLVLLFFPDERARERLRWVAVALLVLAIGGLLLGYVLPFVVDIGSFNSVLYGSWLTRTVAGTLIAIGLWPFSPPPCPRRALWGILAALVGTLVVVVHQGDRLPALVDVGTTAEAVRRSPLPLGDLTGWHWALAVFPLAAVVVAAIGAARHYPGRMLGGWLLVGLAAWSIAQFHDTFWPAAFSPIVTAASRLRLVLAAYITVGAMLEMQRVAVERAVHLARERAASARLIELNRLRDDFTAMVAHELGTPVAAIRRATELATADGLTPGQARALTTIGREVELLEFLVADVQLSAAVEHDAFGIRPEPVAVASLLEDAAYYARTLPGDHPLSWPEPLPVLVMADRERIAQVLRNLLTNAAKYSSSGTPIAVRLAVIDGRLRIAVSDGGPGIGPEELPRIFDKYGRGRDATGRKVPGGGLGLYLSRQIARAHGGDLNVTVTPGSGATFWFDLEVWHE